MKDNRRDFLKKSASLAAAVSVGGMVSAISAPAESTKKANKTKPYVKDGGIKLSYLMGPTSPKVPFAKELGVLHVVSGVERLQGAKAWDPEAISATKKIWDDIGIKWTVVEGPPTLGSQTKLGLSGRDEEI